MGYIGKKPTDVPLTSSDIADGIISTADLANTAVTGAKVNTDVISAQTALTAEPADTDEFLVSDAGVIKRIDYSLIKGGGTHVLLSTTTASSASAIEIESNINSTYHTYMFDFEGLTGTSNSVHLQCRMKHSGGSYVSSGSYEYGFTRAQNNGSSFATGTNATKVQMFEVFSSASNSNLNGRMLLFNPSSSSFDTHVQFKMTGQLDGDFTCTTDGGGRIDDTTPVVGVQFTFSSGNISGKVKLYGIT